MVEHWAKNPGVPSSILGPGTRGTEAVAERAVASAVSGLGEQAKADRERRVLQVAEVVG